MKATDALLDGCSPTYITAGPLGLGLFAVRSIRCGEEILRFTGEVINFAQAQAKNEKECWPLQFGPDLYIDLQSPGCYANHSCDPNSGVVDRDGVVRLVALRQIAEGEEVRYDYSTTMDEDSFQMECRCGEPQCRSVVTDFKLLPHPLRIAYLRAGVVMLFIARQYDYSE